MLRFNGGASKAAGKDSEISIHPMLRFNIRFEVGNLANIRFQYILCYGSTGWKTNYSKN